MVRPQDLPLTASTPPDDLNALVEAALGAVSAGAVVESAYRDATFSADEHVTVLAVGKAASAMTRAFVSRHAARVTGLVIGTHGGAPDGLEWQPGAHPVPDARSERAARGALHLASSLRREDRLVVLVSGGASALMSLPAAGVPFADKQTVIARLLIEGADITALNCVRKHLSAIKGGRLAQACRAHLDAWLLSDVVGDDPSVIGSGPTVPDPSTFADALAVLDDLGGRASYPGAATAHLEAGAAGTRAETLKHRADWSRVTTRVVGSARRALDAAAVLAAGRGYEVVRRPTPVVGEARVAAVDHVAWIRREVGRPGHPVCVLSYGETTVRVTGNGRGGRNQEFALAAALALNGAAWCVASVGTDGVDGPTDAAGAWVGHATLAHAGQAGVDPIAYLDENNSWSFFRAVGGHITTGPTDTNVGDVQFVLIPAYADRK